MNHTGSKSIFYIDSASKSAQATPQTQAASNVTVMVDMPPMNNYNQICVLQASIPKNYFLITDGRKSMTGRSMNQGR